MRVMYKLSCVFILCVFLSLSLAACNGAGSGDLSGSPSKGQEPGGSPSSQGTSGKDSKEQQEKPDGKEEGEGSQEPLLGPDATDEELLEALGDEVHVVTDDDYIEMIASFKEHTEDHSGKIYQIEGVYHVEDGVPYLTRTVVDGQERSESSIPLKYVVTEPEEGGWVKVTGVINEGEMEGKATALLEVVILEPLEEQGQAELSAG